jgi:hypothetical protein
MSSVLGLSRNFAIYPIRPPQLAASFIRHRQLEFCHSLMGAKELLPAPHIVLEHSGIISSIAPLATSLSSFCGLVSPANTARSSSISLTNPPADSAQGDWLLMPSVWESVARSIFRCSVWTWRRRLPPRPYMIARSTLPITSTAKLTAAAATNDRSILSIVTTPSRRAAFSPWHRRAHTMSRICLAEIVRAGV